MTSVFSDTSQDFVAGWLIGFTDGEGCFSISVNNERTTKNGYKRKGELIPSFAIGQYERPILEEIKNKLACGSIRKDGLKGYKFEERGFLEIQKIIIPFFKKHQLRSERKALSFKRFVHVFERMEKKEHEHPEGFKELSALARLINKF